VRFDAQFSDPDQLRAKFTTYCRARYTYIYLASDFFCKSDSRLFATGDNCAQRSGTDPNQIIGREQAHGAVLSAHQLALERSAAVAALTRRL
jgi:hypothetical protein